MSVRAWQKRWTGAASSIAAGPMVHIIVGGMRKERTTAHFNEHRGLIIPV